jgi:hypothetical protein
MSISIRDVFVNKMQIPSPLLLELKISTSKTPLIKRLAASQKKNEM